MDGHGADHRWMMRALELAQRGLYSCHPNPRVGCVLTHSEQLIAEGWHARAGGPHAEAMALAVAGERARGATAYVTLEPCAHHGRTPPCADALIAAGVSRVVYAIDDPFPAVSGRGAARLRAAGMQVESGVGAEPARELNCGFLSRMQRGRPWLRIKLGQSLDGRTALANGRSQWITGPDARVDVQRWRARSSAIITGSATVLADNPRLTARLDEGSDCLQPVPVIVDSNLNTSARARLFEEHDKVLLFALENAASRSDLPGNAQVERVAAGPGGVCLSSVMQRLGELEFNEVQAEAGARLAGNLVASGLVDELLLYMAPSLLGDSARALMVLPELEDLAERWQWQYSDVVRVGEDLRLRLRPLNDLSERGKCSPES